MMARCSMLLILMIAAVLLFGLADSAQAQVTSNLNQNSTYQFRSETHACLFSGAPAGSGISASAWKNQIYTGRMVYCMRELLNNATKVFLNKITQDFGLTVIAASAIFAFGMFGVRISLGMLQNLKSEGFTFLFKIGLIFFLLNNTDFVVDFWFDTLDMFLELIAFGMHDLLTGLNCQGVSNSMSDWFMVWVQFDCLFSKFVGFGTSAAGGGIIVLAGLLASSGGIGMWVAYTAFGAFYAVAQFLFKCAMIAMLSYGGLGLMLMLLPLFLPLILFKQTEDFLYKAWLPFTIGYVLQPALCIAFMIFSLKVLDVVIMQGSQNLYAQYNTTTHSTTYIETTTTPPNSEKGVKTLSEVRGIDPNATASEQKAQMKKTTKQVQSSTQMVQQTSNHTAFQEKDCGKLGKQQTSNNDIITAAAGDDKNFKNCTDPQKCKEAYQNNLNNAPSQGTANSARNVLCDAGKLSAEGSAAQGVQTTETQTGTMTREALDLGANQEKGLADILASLGAIILSAGTFYSMIGHLPGMIEGLSSSNAPKISLHSPSIAGKSAAQRLENALKRSHQSTSNALANNKDQKDPDKKIGYLKRAKSSVGSFIGGAIS